MRAAPIILIVLVQFPFIGSPSSAAEIVPNLYVGKTITTGVTNEHRPAALARCFVDVLVKVSGDPRLSTDRKAAQFAADAASYVKDLHYRDRLEGKPIHDEQGTRDRPHDLTVEFEPQLIDGVVRSLGRQPWAAERPVLTLVVYVHFGGQSYILTRDEPRGVNQREALDAASQQIGLPVRLPHEKALLAANIRTDEVRQFGVSEARDVANSIGADLTLQGTMVFSDEAQGWIVDWHLYKHPSLVHWKVKGVNYDEAFRAGLRGAVQVLSGNGHP
ncbi:DUF2066 domain-containing protein [Microvirga rosea]|uniref:DUF2066 domain-containing protein n=1 Tax=Microvirga rosea TaxID=2715425 RepID=UPI001D0B46B3|nr:DUF2066 domain-containing protein [Microvirga rosea]MCB8823143.1 DUF2066 domain-containing protein [Microvirga rosea]